ncbi:hypothetical protein [Mucilaginibacter sp. AK015]|uniref:pPIWI-associating nuclease domain-containing protein n=1 Tax=Mucilaginibacter sp. AK015 TaxID=2723072 RepID=UPI00160AEB98|nr:hypothetical protein [Mucilaginibacter sp. AK015]MBB5397510.1 hypothetical protein [Mucilaginibacter sp. AK015]
MLLNDFKKIIELSISRVANFNHDVSNITSHKKPAVVNAANEQNYQKDSLYIALSKLSESLSTSYLQVKVDLDDDSRISWAGTAHEIREIVSHILRLLAPDETVTNQPWYKEEGNANGPTQKQRVKLILQNQSAGSKQKEVIELVVNMENLIGSLVRATYSRASDAAHRLKGRKEAKRLIKYFEAFANDLLDI